MSGIPPCHTHPLGFITISNISCRRITILPKDQDLLFVATVTIGDQCFFSTPVAAVFDIVAGMTLMFSETIECRVNASYDSRNGVSISIASEDGSVNLGSACCHLSRDWRYLSKPRGEVQVIFYHSFVEPKDVQPHQLHIHRASDAHSKSANESFTHSRTLRHGAQSADVSRSAPHNTSSGWLSATPPSVAWSEQSSISPRRVTSRASSPTLSTHAPVRTVQVYAVSAEKMAFSSNDEEPLFVTMMFCHQERQTKAVEGVLTATGHTASWRDTLLFDVPTVSTDYSVMVKLWNGNTRASGRLIGQAATTLELAAGPKDVIVFLPQMAHSRVTFTVETETIRPLMEGSHGRPMSAYTRPTTQVETSTSARPHTAKSNDGQAMNRSAHAKTPSRYHSATVSKVQFDDEDEVDIPDDDGGDSIGSEDEVAAFREQQAVAQAERRAAARTGAKSASTRAVHEVVDECSPVAEQQLAVEESMIEEDSVAKKKAREAEFDRMLAEIEATLRHALAQALQPVLLRLTELDKRVRASEVQVAQLLLPRSIPGVDGVTKEPARPSSGASSHSAYDSAATGPQSIVTEDEMQDAFEMYDVNDKGWITAQQLVHFYRTHNSFAMDESADRVEDELKNIVNVQRWREGHVNYDDFCAVALKLAKL